MRKWSLILFCLMLLAAVAVIVGCEGDTGPTGAQGPQGPSGPAGTDPDLAPPAGRPFAFAVTNGHDDAPDGNENMYLTFDSTARGTKDTLVANRVSVPPLIDGFDGEEAEWGPENSKVILTYLNPDSTVQDVKIRRATMRAAYDNDNIYFLVQWSEAAVSVTGNPDSAYTLVSESSEPGVLYFNRLVVQDSMYFKKFSCQRDTVKDYIWSYVRIRRDSTCIIPGITPCPCWNYLAKAETTYVWRQLSSGEDHFALFLPDANPVIGWQQIAVRELFEFTGAGSGIPGSLRSDIWFWGSATTEPVAVADDWIVDAAGIRPDMGNAPYVNNYPTDSVPLYMNRLDPNVRTNETSAKFQTPIYPLWFYAAVPYSRRGWAEGTSNISVFDYLPGFITIIPDGSRADVYATGTFDTGTGTWTVELKRARKTHNGDDVQF